MIVTWNVRGFNQEVKHKELRLFVRRNKVNLIVVCEHRVRQDREKVIINKSLPGWEWCSNANINVRGRLWVAWNSKEISFTKMVDTEQYIHGLVDINNT